MRGTENLIRLVEQAVGEPSVDATVDTIKGELCRLISDNGIEIPARIVRPLDDHYARRLIHRDLERGFSIVAMTWGPSQCTGIHDHAGMWCIEGVWAGSINVKQFELMEIGDEGEYRFEKRNSYQAGRGSAGCLIPPYEYHLIENPSDAIPAVTLHIYGGEMSHCSVYEPSVENWYRRVEKPLAYDQV